ncbi:MAG: RIP metalloprotease RseP [Candidatus Margulisbacteria bacterium]|nr:RIP metalloprotease RseP [Candidatus Margulisiibacteriota bacterium]
MSFVVALLSLSIIVLVHELGHFVTAKSAGISVSEFSIGMGKCFFKKEINGTVFSLRIFPLGGYVRIPALEDKDSNVKISFWNRLKILLAGSINNLLFAWLVFFLIFFVTGIPNKVTNVIETISQNGPARMAGLMQGDAVLSIDGKKVSSGKEVINALSRYEGKEKIILVQRGMDEHSYKVTPVEKAGRSIIGIVLATENKERFSVINSLKHSLDQCINIVVVTYKGLWMLVSRKIGVDQVYGPVGIIQLTSQATSQGFAYFFSFLAMLSINLAVINLFPFPALDGGRIVVLFLEFIFGEKITKKLEYKFHFLGFIILIFFVIYISYFDIHKLLLK